MPTCKKLKGEIQGYDSGSKSSILRNALFRQGIVNFEDQQNSKIWERNLECFGFILYSRSTLG